MYSSEQKSSFLNLAISLLLEISCTLSAYNQLFSPHVCACGHKKYILNKNKNIFETRWCSWNTDLAFTTLLYYSNRSHGTVCTTTCKGRNYGEKWLLYPIPDDCERTATVALPTATRPGFISGEVGISAALDAFSTVYELPLTRFKKGQTNRQTYGHERSLYLAMRYAHAR